MQTDFVVKEGEKREKYFSKKKEGKKEKNTEGTMGGNLTDISQSAKWN